MTDEGPSEGSDAALGSGAGEEPRGRSRDGGSTPVPRLTSRGTNPQRSRAFALELAGLLRDSNVQHIVMLDVRGMSSVSDYILVGSGTSNRQMASALEKACEYAEMLGQHGRVNRDDRSTWLLADFSDVVVHLFEPNTRAYYDIEMLWGDAERVTWKPDAPAEGSMSDLDAIARRLGIERRPPGERGLMSDLAVMGSIDIRDSDDDTDEDGFDDDDLIDDDEAGDEPDTGDGLEDEYEDDLEDFAEEPDDDDEGELDGPDRGAASV